MDRDPSDEFDWEDSTTRGLTRSLVELRDALTPGDDADDPLVRRHRSVIVLTVLVAAFWLGVAGALVAMTREGPFAETVLGFDREVPASAGAAVQIGPNEWPTIAIAPRPFKFKKKAAEPAKPMRKKVPRR